MSNGMSGFPEFMPVATLQQVVRSSLAKLGRISSVDASAEDVTAALCKWYDEAPRTFEKTQACGPYLTDGGNHVLVDRQLFGALEADVAKMSAPPPVAPGLPSPPDEGMSTTTKVLIVAAVGTALYFMFRKPAYSANARVGMKGTGQERGKVDVSRHSGGSKSAAHRLEKHYEGKVRRAGKREIRAELGRGR